MGDKDHDRARSQTATFNRKSRKEQDISICEDTVKTTGIIRQFVEKALYVRELTPEIEKGINEELTRLGYISDIDYEALELLMAEMDAGRIQPVSQV
jgi:hypothetical protein